MSPAPTPTPTSALKCLSMVARGPSASPRSWGIARPCQPCCDSRRCPRSAMESGRRGARWVARAPAPVRWRARARSCSGSGTDAAR
eukprot:811114-Pyramimonas_sp.AAC.1